MWSVSAKTRAKLDGSPEGGWYANEALSREDSLRAMALAGAHAAFQDDTLGSLTPGKWAGFVVLFDNPLMVTNIPSFHVDAIYVAGEAIVGVATETPY